MKFRRGAATAAIAASGAYAQSAPTYSEPASSSSAVISAPTPPPSSSVPGVTYTTVTYDDCSTASLETMITVTNGVTVTYCPECEHSGTIEPTATSQGHTTVYTTTYLSLCETGTVPVTYTVTESCAEETPTWTPGPSHIPQGYTVTVKDCTVCHSDLSKPSTIPVTITEPCGCDAEEGTTIVPTKKPAPATATPTGKPVQQISDGQVQNPTGGKPIAEASKPDATGPKPTGGAYEPPAAATTGPDATGPKPTAGPYPTTPAGPVRPEAGGNTTHVAPTPYEGAASTTAGVASLLFTILIGGLAFAL